MRKLLYTAALISMLALITVGCSNDLNPLGSTATDRVVPTTTALATADGMTATLHLYVTQYSGHVVYLHRVTADWDELSVTWANFSGAYDPAIIGSFVSDGIGWHSVDVTGLVDSWLNGDVDNFGILMDQGDPSWPRTIVSSRDNAVNQPYLEICYSEEGCEQIPAFGDAYIYELYPDANTGSKIELDMGWYDETDLEKQALIRFDFPEVPDDYGCTATIGYWKNHAGFGPQDDMVSPHLPIWLGVADSDASLLVTDAATAVKVLSMKTYGRSSNGITKLYAQMLAAKLNIAAGADSYDIDETLATADAFLAVHDWQDWSDLGYEQRQMVLGWMEMFDKYNNGEIGPGHCDDDNVQSGCKRCKHEGQNHRHHGGNGHRK